MHRVRKVLSPDSYVRVICAHHMLKGGEDNFDAIISYLSEKFQIITPSRFFQMFGQDKKIDGQFLLITFDDGLLSSYFAAKKILSRYNLKAIFFVPTKILELKSKEEMKDFVSRSIYFGETSGDNLREEEYLTMGKEEILDLHREGHVILPHTHTHRKLADIDTSEMVEREIVKPKMILRELLQNEINAFAFPVGTERVVSPYAFPAIQSEYQFCFSNLAGMNTLRTDPYFLYRDCVHTYYDLKHVQNITDGMFDFYYLWKMRRLKCALTKTCCNK